MSPASAPFCLPPTPAGAFYTRLTGEQTYPITLSLTEAGQVAVGVGTPLGVACTLLYAAVGASATNVLDA